MKYVLVAVVLAVAGVIGVAALYFGQIDDSPGLGGIGLLIMIAAVWYSIRVVRRKA